MLKIFALQEDIWWIHVVNIAEDMANVIAAINSLENLFKESEYRRVILLCKGNVHITGWNV